MNRYATEHSDFETVDDLNRMNRRRHRSKIQNIKNNDAHNIDYESNSTKKSCNTNDTAPEDIANRDVANTFHHSSDCLQHSESIQDIPNLVDFASGGKENTFTSDEDEFIVDPLSIPPVLGRDFTLEGDDHLCPKLPTLHELVSTYYHRIAFNFLENVFCFIFIDSH